MPTSAAPTRASSPERTTLRSWRCVGSAICTLVRRTRIRVADAAGIVVSHIVTPARRAAKEADKLAAASPAIIASADGLEGELTDKPLVGTGGSDLVAFLRLTRAKTIEAMLRPT